MLKREDVCKKAIDIITGDREKDYGTPEDSFETIADFWRNYLRSIDHPVDNVDAAVMMALMKIARIANGRFKEDSFVDAIGYLAIAAELSDFERKCHNHEVSADNILMGTTAYTANGQKLTGILDPVKITKEDVDAANDITKSMIDTLHKKLEGHEPKYRCENCEFFSGNPLKVAGGYCRHNHCTVNENEAACGWYADGREEDIDE